jgi:hypothetical protein
MVQLAVFASQAEDEGGSSQIAGQPDHNAVRRTLPFDLYPPALARQIATVCTFGNDTLEARYERQPLLGQLHVGRLIDALQAAVSVFEHLPECAEAHLLLASIGLMLNRLARA